MTQDDCLQALLFRDRVKMLIYEKDGVDPSTVPDSEVLGAVELLVHVYNQLPVNESKILADAMPSILSQDRLKLADDLRIANEAIAKLVSAINEGMAKLVGE